MAVPNTGGILRTSIADMQVGDYISCLYNADTKSFSRIGDVPGGQMPYTGITAGSNWFYFIKVDGESGHGSLLIADRVCHNTISWDSLNQNNYIQGKPLTLSKVSGILRSLGGGNSYADASGNSSTVDKGLGAWPTDNEFDQYVAGMFNGADDVWHNSSILSWANETPITGVGVNTTRVIRGNANYVFSRTSSNNTQPNVGFRPVFEYQEVTP